MSTTTYYVWKDNFLEEYFALEKTEMDSNKNFFNALLKEKSVLNTVEADGIIDAIQKHKENIKATPNQVEEESYHFSPTEKTTSKNQFH